MGLLTTLGIVALNHARAKARDVRRVADLDQFSTAMEMHFNGHNAFPNTNGVQCLSTCEQETPPSWCTDFKTFIKYIPEDPMEPSLQNCYLINSDGENYRIAAHLEKDPDKMRNDGGAYLQFYEVYSDPTTPLLTGWNDPDTGPWQGQLGGTMITALDEDLVGHWSLAESDEVVGSRDALSFDSVDDYVNAGAGTNLNITNTISVSVWIKPMGIGSNVDQYGSMALVKGGGVNPPAYGLGAYYYTTKKLGGAMIYSDNTMISLWSTSLFTEGTWNYVVSTYDGSYQRLYINGNLEATSALIGKSLKDLPSGPLYFGKWGYGSSYQRTFNGSVSDVRIYNIPLSGPQVGLLYNGTDITEGLVSHWELDEEDGTNAEDSFGDNDGTLNGGSYWTRQTTDLSGNGNTGTTHNISYALDHNGAYNGAMSFDGVDDYVDCGNNTSLLITDDITVLIWIKGTTPDASDSIISRWDTGANKRVWDIYGTNTNLFGVQLSDDGTFNAGHRKQYLSSNAVYDNNWHQIGFTFNTGTLKLYRDGVEDTGSVNFNDSITFLKSNDIQLMMGANLNNGVLQRYSNGSISDVRIYDRALDEDEIRTLYLGTE